MSVWKPIVAGIILLGTLLPANALAQRALSCASCAACTDALGVSEAKVELSGDLVHEGDGPCIVIRGADARLDGLERDIRSLGGANTVGVRVEADGVIVRNVHVVGAEVGIQVESARRVTLFHNWLRTSSAGIVSNQGEGLRVSRSVIQTETKEGTVGVALGSGGAAVCGPGAAFAQSDVVVQGNHISGAQTGILACDALPVLSRNVVTGNEVGVKINAPAKGADGTKARPWDSCACAPEVTEVTSSTTLFYSSGCHGCQVHEEWLPDLRSRGHDIRIRETGPENRLASQEFDAFIDRCIPQIMDAIGVPGCVPNYGCLSNDVTFKLRDGEKNLVRETEINSSADLAHYATECAQLAERNYGKGDACIQHLLMDNTVCGNATGDIQAEGLDGRWKGVGNACATAKGYGDDGAASERCSRVCSGDHPVPAMPAAREREARRPPPPPMATPAPPAPAPAAAAPAPAVAAEAPAVDVEPAQEEASVQTISDNMLLGMGLLALLVVIGFFWGRDDGDDAGSDD